MKTIRIIGILLAVVLGCQMNMSCKNDDDESIDASNYPTAIVGTWMEDDQSNEESVTWVFNADGTGSYYEDVYEDSFRYHFTEGRNFVLNIWGTSLHCAVQKLTKNECYFYIEEEGKGPHLKRKK